jgi:Heterokaryon incompatibility protein (HET)
MSDTSSESSHKPDVSLNLLPRPNPAGLYRKLPLEDDEIRVFDLLPGVNNDQIRCFLRVIRFTRSNGALHGGSDYEACSYVCGEGPTPHQIRVNGRPFYVRENLHRLLQQLRSSTTPRTLWVDAICINGVDMDERGAQVRLMGDIYRGAKRALVWLGAATNRNLYYRLREMRGQDLNGHFGPRPGKQDPLLNSLFLALDRCSDYWERTWVVQEFILAKDLELYYGDVVLSWDFLAQRTRTTASDQQAHNTRSWALCQQRLRPPSQHDILHLIVANRKRRCRDRHDKVYALLSLVTDPDPLSLERGRHLEIDYRSGMEALFCTVWDYITDGPQSVQPCDVFAYACALKRMLGLDSNLDTDPCPGAAMQDSPFSSGPLVETEGFLIGRIAAVRVLKVRPPVRSTHGTPSLPWTKIQRELKAMFRLPQWQDKRFSAQLIDRLSRVAASSIYLPPGVLDSMNQRLLPNSIAYEGDEIPRGQLIPCFSFVTVEFKRPGSQTPTHAIGLTCGNTAVGNVVVQFAHCDIAFAAQVDSEQAAGQTVHQGLNAKQEEVQYDSSLTAKLVYVDSLESWTSQLTGERHYFGGLRDQVELTPRLRGLRYRLTATELLAVAS